MVRLFLNLCNFVLSLVMCLCLLSALSFAGYALWDNAQVYQAAENVQADMIKLKPKTEDTQEGPTFDELRSINPDVCGWVTLDNTKIDYPILQGEDNLTYINTDVYGNFALAGSIFLDVRNDPSFTDMFSLLYGHHMENSAMFGDLDLYKDARFFQENTTGSLLTPDGAYDLEIFACLVVNASDENVFEPTTWQTSIDPLLAFAQSEALHWNPEVAAVLEEESEPHILALSTCSSEFSDARTVVLTRMIP